MHRRLLSALAAALVCGTVAADRLSAQIQPIARPDTTAAPRAEPRARTEVRSDPRRPLLDRPVDRAEYRVGPGDVLEVSIFGEVERQHTVTVSPEGSMVVPGIGVAEVLGTSLDETEARVRRTVARFYRNVDVRVTLAEVRSFKVFLVGDVPEPGIREASSATRVSEVVPADTAVERVARRNVLLRRANGDSVRVDLARFLQTGDLRANPTLREGDAIVVPAVDRVVRVYGRVPFPGEYEYRPGESLAELLAVANGAAPFLADAADVIRVARFTPAGEREVGTFTQAEALGARGAAFQVAPFDAVFVPSVANYRRQFTATVLGQVQRPGTYPIRPDTTTLRELVEMAGGFTPEASLGRTVLRRQREEGGRNALSDLANTPSELLSRAEQQILQIATQGNDRNVVVDFNALRAGDEAYNPRLQSGDTLVVPQHVNQVTVLGAVRRPGIVQNVPGQQMEDVIRLAGGYTRQANARQAVVLRNQSGARLHRREISFMEAGDVVIVPFRERVNVLDALQTTHAVVGTVTGLIAIFLTVIR